MTGKQKCALLRDMRCTIAAHNDIDLPPHDCTHQGDCPGTCPRCEQEARALDAQLRRRAALGKKVILAGLCAGMIIAAAGCTIEKDPAPTTDPGLTGMVAVEPLDGDVAAMPLDDVN